MVNEITSLIIYFIKLSFTPEVLWEIVPLFFATIIILSYFEKYKHERENWGAYLSNSLVLFFVSLGLFRYIYGIGIGGFDNFITYSGKSIAAIFVLFIGWAILKFNFNHILPEKFAKHLSSVLTLHLFAYAIILFVHSNLGVGLGVVVALLFIIVVISIVLNIIKIPLKMFFAYAEKIKEKERIGYIKEEEFEIKEMEKKLKELRTELKKVELKKAEKEKKEAMRIKKEIKKIR
ncbi:MAG: hypothetical protein AABW79_00410 [Nanoarchaeota archaeon]